MQGLNESWNGAWDKKNDPSHTHECAAKVRIVCNACATALLHSAFVPKEEHPGQHRRHRDDKKQQQRVRGMEHNERKQHGTDRA